MDITIPASNLKVFTSAISALSKTGQTLFISCKPDELSLRTINDSKSAYLSATFGRSFFSGSGSLVTLPTPSHNNRKRSRSTSSDSSTDEEPSQSSQQTSQRNRFTPPSNPNSAEQRYCSFKAKLLLKQVASIMKGRVVYSQAYNADSSYSHSSSNSNNNTSSSSASIASSSSKIPVMSLRITSHGGGVCTEEDEQNQNQNQNQDQQTDKDKDDPSNSNSNSSMLLRFVFQQPNNITKTHLIPISPLVSPIIAVCQKSPASRVSIAPSYVKELISHISDKRHECQWIIEKGNGSSLKVASYSPEEAKRIRLEKHADSSSASAPNSVDYAQVKNTKRSEARLEVSQVARFDFYVPKRTPPTRHVNLNTMTESTQDTQYDDENTFDEEAFNALPPDLTTTSKTPSVQLVFSPKELKSLLAFCGETQKNFSPSSNNSSFYNNNSSFVSNPNSSSVFDDEMVIDFFFLWGGKPVLFSVDSMGGRGHDFQNESSSSSDDDDDDDDHNSGNQRTKEVPNWSLELILATLNWAQLA